MKVSLLLIALSALLSLSFAAEEVGNANKYVDMIMEMLTSNEDIMKYIDPVTIPDIDRDNVKMTGVTLVGLSTIGRKGDCTLDTSIKRVIIEANLGISNITFEGKIGVKKLFWISGEVEGYFKGLTVNLRINIPLLGGLPKVEELKVTDYGFPVITKTSGMSIVLNWAVQLLMNTAITDLIPYIVNLIQDKIYSFLDENIKNIKLPFP